ncbi:hypothetical protein EWM64_g10797 [Hericium alpestre]|uniref:U3 small nucleolar RNA-associated protein 11 n=1 Tax=Hericium alpestre TaxID=135208 RepID=A0A4Y9ZEL6_9AGAM|nr:hypothetical protein EWM64_g10797 [Hericium alpestre]
MVKILKSQDENYVRTMRTAGLKKIEKLKNQLSALTDLLKPALGVGEEDQDEEGLDEDELEILRKAGVLAGPSISQRKSSSKRSSKHIVFAEDEAEAHELAASRKTQSPTEADAMVVEENDADLGWNFPSVSKPLKKRTSKGGSQEDVSMEKELENEERKEASKLNRSRLLKELSARLHRDRMLRYAERELEMQKLLMGKGTSKKLQGVERIGGEGVDDEDDEDALDARRGKRSSKVPPAVDEKVYKPRVYKWRAERKK